MPSEAQFNEWWLWASTLSYFSNGIVFFVQGHLIRREHAKVDTKPSRVGHWLIRMFTLAACKSVSISVLFGLALWALLEGTGSPPPPPSPIPFEARTLARVVALAFPWAVNGAGVMVVRAVREEARRRSRGESW